MNLYLSGKTTSLLAFDPKSKGQTYRQGIVRTWDDKYPQSLAKAVVTAGQFASKKQFAGNSQNSRTTLWADLTDIQANHNLIEQAFSATKTECNNERQTFRLNTTGIESSSIEQTDHAGQMVQGFQTHALPVQFMLSEGGKTKEEYVSVYENQDLHHLNDHAKKQGYITPDQHQEIDYLIRRIDPRTQTYLFEMGVINDIKKSVQDFLMPKVFGGGAFYYDLDRADRAKPVTDDHILSLMKESKGNTTAPIGLCSINEGNDVLLAHGDITDSENLYPVIHGYYKILSLMGDEFYQNLLHSSNPNHKEVRQAFKDQLNAVTITKPDVPDNKPESKNFLNHWRHQRKSRNQPNTKRLPDTVEQQKQRILGDFKAFKFQKMFPEIEGIDRIRSVKFPKAPLQNGLNPYSLPISQPRPYLDADELFVILFDKCSWLPDKVNGQTINKAYEMPTDPHLQNLMLRRKDLPMPKGEALFAPVLPSDDKKTWK